MAQVPSNLIPTRITQLPDAPVASEDGLLYYVYGGNSYKIRAGDLLQVAGVPTSRQVIAGTGLTGGGALSSNVTLSIAYKAVGPTLLANTGVTAGVYGDSGNIPQFTVDETGRITAATNVPFSVAGYVPVTRQVIAGTGLSGGGALNANVTLTANLSGVTPLTTSGAGSSGSSEGISRADHRHPAVDLSDADQVDNVLGLANGGTARSLVMQSGAVMWSGSDGLYVGPVGTAGQVLVSGGTGAPTWGSTLILAPVTRNYFFAGPTSGSAADPTFRAMVNADLPASGVVPNTYGSGANMPVLVVNDKGVITSASTTAVTPAWTNVTGTPTTVAGYGITDAVTLTGTQTLTNKTLSGAFNTFSNIGNASLSNSTIGFTYSGGITGSASVALGDTNALALSNVPNSSLQYSSVTFNGQTVALGGSGTITAVSPYALTIGTGLGGVSYDGSAAVTITNTGVLSNAAGTGLSVSSSTGNVTVGFSNAAVGTWAATPSSANLAAAMTDETGSGALVFANGPTLSGPTIDGANPYVQFSNGAAVTLAAGRMWYDGATGALNFGMGGGNITQQVGEELFVYGKASAAITDSPLKIIYQTGTVGGSGVITFAPTVAGITDGDLIVGVATEPIANNAFGRVTSFGIVRGITTDGSAYGETWADGDTIWYNPVTGNPTNIKPSAPNIKVSVGILIKAGSGGSGSIQIEINHGSVLGGTDSNVQLTSVANDNLLQYYAAGGYWRNVAPSAVTGVGSLANALTIGTGLSGTSYNGSSAVTIAIDSTVVTLTGAQVLTNKTISGSSNTLSNIANASLVNSAVTVNGTSISLGGSATITAVNPNALTLGSYLTGTSYNGSAAVTAAVDATSSNTASKVVARDASGNFSANVITAVGGIQGGSF